MATRMLQRRGTAAEWAAQNPVLSAGEIGFETDTKVVKLGDGVTAWNDLTGPYLNRAGGTMTGALILVAPTEDDHAARLLEVKTRLPLTGGTLTGPLILENSLTLIAPTETNHAVRLADLSAYLKLSGGTMTGALSLIAPTEPAHAARLEDVVAADAIFETFTASGTWTKPTDAKFVVVEMWAGGGGGGAGYDRGGAGGAGGGWFKKTINANTLGETESVTVGAGGAGGTTTSGYAGGGGDSVFNSAHAFGGDGGLNNYEATTEVQGGFLDGADFNTTSAVLDASYGGAAGHEGSYNSNNAGGTSVYGGNGGTGAGNNGSVRNGYSGSILGGGGGGGADSNSAGISNGGAGGRGEVRITTYF